MIPLAVPNLTGKEREYLIKCIDTTFVSSVGEYVNKLESMMAEKTGTKYGVSTSSGTTALHLALIGCGVGRDDVVIIPTFTFIATANAVAHCGATPWLMDINPESWTMDDDALEVELNNNSIWDGNRLIHKGTGKRIAAIMPVYTLGNIPNMKKIKEIAERYKLPLIADAAAALGAEYEGKKSGQLADLTIYSFNGNKTVTAGGGGMIVGNNESLMNKLKHLSTTARVSLEYDHDMVGYNYRMTNIQAAVGCAQLERSDEFVERKREIRNFYNQQFSELSSCTLFPVPEGVKSSCWFSGIVLQNGGIENIRFLCSQLKKSGIESRSFWKPIHLQAPYKDAIKAKCLDVASDIWCRILTLPCSTNITIDELNYVATKVKELLG